LFALLMKHRVPCAPVRTLMEVVNDPHLHQRGMLQWIDHPELGRIVVQSSPMRYDGAVPLPHEPSQTLGQSNDAVLSAWLGLSKDRVGELAKAGVI
jgi:formyl-CoA transferase